MHRQLTYTDLFEFISKNQELNDRVDALDQDDPGMEELHQHVKLGTPEIEVFHPENTDLFLLRLFKDNKITAGEFVTGYQYFSAVLEFTSYHRYGAGDEHLKARSGAAKKIILMRLIEDDVLTPLGEQYVDDVIQQYKTDLQIDINKEDLVAQLKALRPIEQSVIHMVFKNLSAMSFLHSYAVNVPGVMSSEMRNRLEGGSSFFQPVNYALTIPSHAIFNLLLNQYCDDPIILVPRFGQVGPDTLLTLHEKDEHPLPLYNRFVKNNFTFAHGIFEGALSMWIHDLAHRLVSGLISPAQRRSMIHAARELQVLRGEISHDMQASGAKDTRTILTFLNKLIERLNDLDFFNQKLWVLTQEQRVAFVREETFLRTDPYMFNFFRPHDCLLLGAQAVSYYFIERMALRHGNDNGWVDISHAIETHHQLSERENQIQAIKKIACFVEKNGAHAVQELNIPPDRKIEINWKIWQAALENKTASADVFKYLIEHACTDDLLTMINECGLVFFHPLVPLTEEKHAHLLEFVSKNLALEAAVSHKM